jgi:hypothetical protein
MKLGRLISGARIALVFIVVVLCAGTGCPTIGPGMPDNAVLLVDDAARTYMSPPCLASERPDLRVTTNAKANELNYRPDHDCREDGGFFQEGRSMTGILLEAVGVLRPLPSRWTADGQWNW